MKRFISPRHYIAVLRRQSSHVQHGAALVFASLITALLAVLILHVNYGFWNDAYSQGDESVKTSVEEEMVTTVSPKEMVSGFFDEAGKRLTAIRESKNSLFQGTASYSRDDK